MEVRVSTLKVTVALAGVALTTGVALAQSTSIGRADATVPTIGGQGPVFGPAGSAVVYPGGFSSFSAFPVPYGTVSIDGATLFQSFFTEVSGTSDVIDLDRDTRVATFPSILDQMAKPAPTYADLTPDPVANNGAAGTLSWWGVWERRSGSVNGLENLIYSQFWGTLPPVPVSGNETVYNRTVAPPATIQRQPLVDIAVSDVATDYSFKFPGTPAWNRNPGDAGYGGNDVNSAVGINAVNQQLLPVEIIPAPGTPAQLINTPVVAFAVAFIANPGIGNRVLSKNDAQYLFTTGRTRTGENLVAVTRDIGSGTRNSSMNAIGVDPSWGVGENDGRSSGTAAPGGGGTGTPDAATQSEDGVLPGAGLNSAAANRSRASDKFSSNRMRRSVRNFRLGVGYQGSEGALNNQSINLPGAWYMLPYDADNDGTGVVPTNANVVNGLYNILGVEVFITNGRPDGADGVAGLVPNPSNDPVLGPGATAPVTQNDNFVGHVFNVPSTVGIPADLLPTNRLPAGSIVDTRNYAAAGYLLNIRTSLENVTATGLTTDTNNFNTPASVLTNLGFYPIRGLRALPAFNNPDILVNNDPASGTVGPFPPFYGTTDYLTFLGDFVATNPAGVAPTRVPTFAAQTGVVPAQLNNSAAIQNVALYQDVTGANIPFNTSSSNSANSLSPRNKVAGDFAFNGTRDFNDIPAMVQAFLLPAAFGVLPENLNISNGGQGNASIDLLGDFDADADFDRDDVYYFCDGLALQGGVVARQAAFTALDLSPASDGNVLDVTINGSAVGYLPGDARFDVNNDGDVNSADRDIVLANLGRNWQSSVATAIAMNLSADVAGNDLIVDAADLAAIDAKLGIGGGAPTLLSVVSRKVHQP